MAEEHILVCLSSSPSNSKVIKTASKMAEVFNAKFTALYIETSYEINEDNKKRLEDNTNLAKQCGAQIVTVNGDNIPVQISQYSKASKVSKIVIGRAGYRPNSLFSPPNLIDKLIELTPEIEIYIIPDKVQDLYINRKCKEQFDFPKVTLNDSLKSVFILALVTLLCGGLHALNINESNIIMMYILAVLVIAYVTESKVYCLVSSLFSVLIFRFLFTYPYFSFEAKGTGYTLTFIIMFLVAFLASSITKRVKNNARLSSLKAYSTEIMLEMSQKLQQCTNKSEITDLTKRQINKLLDSQVNVVLKEDGSNDRILKWVFTNNKQAGKNSENFSDSDKMYFPISNLDSVFGVVILSGVSISEFEKNLLIAMLRESALAYEKDAIAEVKNQLLIRNKQEELRSTMLRAISHDLRTPLTSISGYADILMNNSTLLSENKKHQIYSDIYDDAIWLLNLVENLLSITRFDKKEITIKKQSELISDVITEAVAHVGRKKENYNIKTVLEEESLSAKMDGKLIAQVIFNLVDNAIKYTPANTTITIRAKSVGEYVEVSVEDEGYGISDENKKKIFDMFYTVNNSIVDGRRGLGLGLALCKAAIEAHGGTIDVKDNNIAGKGTIFSFKLLGEFDV